MFCSEMQLDKYRPNQYCDLVALVLIAYYFIYRNIPITKYAA